MCAVLVFAGPAVLPAAAAPSFGNDVMAVLSKAGCNAGPCHGNANGKGGFKLSLRGEDPSADYRALVHEAAGRRIDLLDPAQSLLLRKPLAMTPHEGGRRFETNAPEHRILRDWIGAGAPADAEGTPRLTNLEVSPGDVVLVAPAATVDLRVTAHFSDGSSRDVSRLAVYEPVGSMFEVNATGQVRATDSGEGVIVVRFLSGQRAVRLAHVPVRPEFKFEAPVPRNYIDEHLFARMREVRVNPSALCSDEEFVRRVHLDLLGLLPGAAKARSFVADPDPGKRERLVAELLQRPEFGEFWALKWADLLRAEERLLDRKGLELFHAWLRDAFNSGMPLDRFARAIVGATGSTYQNPPANFYRAVRDPAARAEAVAQVFLGTRLNCAQCHNHPFDRWTQDDYYDWAGTFAGIRYKVLENRRRDDNDQHEFKGEQVVFVAAKADFNNPRTRRGAQPRMLGDDSAVPDASRVGPAALDRLASWVADPANPFFARAQANRLWFHLMGRGLVEPIDDFRHTNPPTHPALLEALAADLVTNRFDLRALLARIAASAAYQLAARPNESNAADELHFARAAPRRLGAEQLLDCMSQVLEAPLDLPGYPPGTRAQQMAGALSERRRDQRRTETDQFLEIFGKPPRLLTCECERSSDSTMGQAFQMISGPAANRLLTHPGNRLGRWVAANTAPQQVVEELYWSALARPPSAHELASLTARILETADRRQGIEDVAWALLNSKEFMLRK